MLTAISYACDPLPVPPHSTFQVRWSPWDGNKPRGGMERIPTELLGSALPAAEATRDELQKGLAQGWGPWMHASMLDLVKLPEAAVVTTQLCTSGGEGAQCIQTAQPDGHKQNAKSAYVRVGHHAYDRSYVQYYLGHSSADQLPLATNVSVEYSVSKGGSELDVLITPLGNASESWRSWAAGGVELVLLPRFGWLQAGSVVMNTTALTLTAAGMAPVVLHTTAEGTVDGVTQRRGLRIPLGNGPVGFSTTAGRSVESLQALLAKAAAKEEALLADTYREFATHAMAVKGSAMWNLIYSERSPTLPPTTTATPPVSCQTLVCVRCADPSENGAALLPVSRDWNFAPSPISDDWTYAVFDWE
jgi:hypothetical protein